MVGKLFDRNLGFISSDEQSMISNSVVALAGAGGDGGLLAVQLARMGIGEIRLADPDPFEAENSNRQAVCNNSTIGVNKAEAVSSYIKEVNPSIETRVYNSGITGTNVEDFVTGADLVIDETEFTLHAVGVLLARESRKQNVPNLTAFNIGFGAIVTTYQPRGWSVEKTLGLDEQMPLDEIAEQEVPLRRWLPYIPPYADLEVFKKVKDGDMTAPSVAPGVALAAGAGCVQAFLNIVSGNRRPKPIYAPRALQLDVMEGSLRTVKLSSYSHYKYLSGVVVRNMLKLNPRAAT